VLAASLRRVCCAVQPFFANFLIQIRDLAPMAPSNRTKLGREKKDCCALHGRVHPLGISAGSCPPKRRPDTAQPSIFQIATSPQAIPPGCMAAECLTQYLCTDPEDRWQEVGWLLQRPDVAGGYCCCLGLVCQGDAVPVSVLKRLWVGLVYHRQERLDKSCNRTAEQSSKVHSVGPSLPLRTAVAATLGQLNSRVWIRLASWPASLMPKANCTFHAPCS
jgi:hypothetical protein